MRLLKEGSCSTDKTVDSCVFAFKQQMGAGWDKSGRQGTAIEPSRITMVRIRQHGVEATSHSTTDPTESPHDTVIPMTVGERLAKTQKDWLEEMLEKCQKGYAYVHKDMCKFMIVFIVLVVVFVCLTVSKCVS